MQTETAASPGDRYEPNLPLSSIYESPRNPRKTFNQAKLDELAKSIGEHGIIQPLLLRLNPTFERTFELLDGARRFRAALQAGLAAAPARIIEVSDATAMEIQLIANLQREDVPPLEEALGFRRLISDCNHDVPLIAMKVGKSESYVYQRLKLTDLVQQGQDKLAAGEITLTMALMLARLQPDDQRQAIETRWAMGSARELQNWIENYIFLQLKKAPWKSDDADLVPSAGSCDACPKRTGASPALFPEVKAEDVCTDPGCYAAKRIAFVARQQQRLAEKNPDLVQVSGGWGKNDKGLPDRSNYEVLPAKEAKANPDAKQALVVDGEDAGKVIYILPTKKGGFQKTDAEKEKERKAREKERREHEPAGRAGRSDPGRFRTGTAGV